MKALVLNSIGQPLDYQDVIAPCFEQKRVLIQLKSAALNHRDLWISKGQYAGIKTPLIPGSDGSGIYNEKTFIINPSFQWGAKSQFQGPDYQILGLPDNGTFAEMVAVPVSNLVPKPEHLNWDQASALPLAGVTAYRVLFSRCQLKKGEKVLVTGAGGGVALFVIQFALAAGAEVWVTSGSEEKIEKAVALGARGGENYKGDEWDKRLKSQTGGFDVIIDSAGGDQFAKLIALCKPGARAGIYGGTLGKINQLSPQILFWKQISILGSTMGNPSDFKKMVQFVEKHQIVPVIDSVFDLKDGNAALERMASGKHFGKIVLRIS